MTRSELLDALADGAVVATGNARLARSLAAEFDRRMLERGRAAWRTPAVLPWSAWLLETYAATAARSKAPLPRIVSAEQEEQVWAAVIREDEARLQQALLRIDATARRARAAWQLLREWRLDLADGRFGEHEDAAAFRRWALRFRALGERRGEAAEADLPNLLQPLPDTGAGVLPPRLILAGFYELTPAQAALIESFGTAGCPVDWAEPGGPPGRARRLRADDARHEMRLAAGWARRILQEQPQARIGIVAVDLAARRSALAQVLGQVLDPAALAPGALAAPRPWNLSLGRPLSDQPVVATALRLLALMRQPADTATLGVLLRSPHWALPRAPAERRAELERRALLDRRIRELGDTRMRLSNLFFQASGDDAERAARPWHSPLLAARCGALLEASRDLPAHAAAGAWAAAFTAWLKAAGWGAQGGGGRPLDSHEFQAVEAWNSLLSRFSSLSDFAGSLSLAEALALLGRLAGEALFQPRGADAPVQVLGLHEAIGQAFDHLWVMGLHDGAWPPAAAPDPFIPLGLQRERGLPHSGPDLELDWAARVTERLGAAAAEVVFSHPGRDGNEVLGCSPLIAALPELAAGDLVSSLPGFLEARWHRRVRESAAPETVPALASVPAPVALRNPDVRGGSQLFGDQAACPFKAFATHRLGARPLERPQAGLDAARKGSVLHRVLERLWQDLQCQANLLALDDAAQRELLRAKIGEVLEAQRRRSPATFTERFRALETQRLEERLSAWLELERRRSPFTVVASEQLRRCEIGGLRLGVKIDRVDRLDDGAQVVLDYKTGKVRPSAWFGPRPEEPQLPLYAVASRDGSESGGPGGGAVAAVAFAQIRAERVGFSGVVRDAGVLPGLPSAGQRELREACEQWPAVLDAWAAELERLAAAFRSGDAAVDPKHGLKTCDASYCQLAPLCRVRESLPGAADAGENDDDDGGEDD